MKKTILFLAANPSQTTHLRLNAEMREIDEALRLSKHRDNFVLETKVAVRPRDIRRALFDYQPHIVHFSGHGTGKTGLVFEDDDGKEKLVSGKALANLFGFFINQIECVLLNACYSAFQADAIVQNIDYVVGMNDAIGDKAAIEFSVGFYDALAAYQPELYPGFSPIEFAFNIARNAIEIDGLVDYQTPTLEKNTEILQEEWKVRLAYEAVKAFGRKTTEFNTAAIEVETKELIRAYKTAKKSKSKPILFEQAVLEVENKKLIHTYRSAKKMVSNVIPFDQVVAQIEGSQ